MKKFLLILSILFPLSIFAEGDDWSHYGKDSGGGHYSKATEITPENVKYLKNIFR